MLNQAVRREISDWRAFMRACAVAAEPAPASASTDVPPALEPLVQRALALSSRANRFFAQAAILEGARRLAEGKPTDPFAIRRNWPRRLWLTSLRAESATASDARVAVFLDHVRNGRFRQRAAAELIARDVGISAPYLHRLVFRDTGVSIQEHLFAWRFLEIGRLLSVTFLSVKEIAGLVGLEHVPSLDRCFRRACMVAPTDFRRDTRRLALGILADPIGAVRPQPTPSIASLRISLAATTNQLRRVSGRHLFGFVEEAGQGCVWLQEDDSVVPWEHAGGPAVDIRRSSELAAARADVFRSGAPRRVLATSTRAGREVRYEVVLTPLRDHGDAVIGLYGLGCEIEGRMGAGIVSPLAADYRDVPAPVVARDVTRRERELLESLVRCRRLRDTAADLGISIHTARNHLKSIFRKLGVRSQADLLAAGHLLPINAHSPTKA